MKKFKIGLGIMLLVILGILIFRIYPLDIKDNSTIVDSNKEFINSNEDDIKSSKGQTDKQPLKTDSNKSTNDVSKNSKSSDNTVSNDDYSILVQSPVYDAIVQLDNDSKEIKVKVLDDSNVDSYDASKYINLTEEDVNYLKENANDLLKEFDNGSLLDKYSFVTNMLKEYDTNINMGDLINIALTYLK